MVDAHTGTIADGVFATNDGSSGFAASAPVLIESLSRGTVVAITLTTRLFKISGKNNYRFETYKAKNDRLRFIFS